MLYGKRVLFCFWLFLLPFNVARKLKLHWFSELKTYFMNQLVTYSFKYSTILPFPLSNLNKLFLSFNFNFGGILYYKTFNLKENFSVIMVSISFWPISILQTSLTITTYTNMHEKQKLFIKTKSFKAIGGKTLFC